MNSLLLDTRAKEKDYVKNIEKFSKFTQKIYGDEYMKYKDALEIPDYRNQSDMNCYYKDAFEIVDLVYDGHEKRRKNSVGLREVTSKVINNSHY